LTREFTSALELELVWGGKSHTLRLADGEHRVGRAHDNEVQIPDARVSKYHALIRVQGDRLFVADLGSTNGTEVDGQPVGRDETEIPFSSTVRFAGTILRRAGVSPSTTHNFMLRDDASAQLSYHASEGFTDAARDRIIALSSDLFELLASDRGASELESAACAFVSEFCAADRVVLLTDQGEGTGIEQRARWIRAGDKDAPLRLSSTIVGEVLQRRNSVLVANPLDDPKFLGHQSIVDLHLRSAMAAPLFDNHRVRGILYVDTANAATRYTPEDLQVLTATANAVAVKLRSLSLEKEMRTAARIQQSMLPKNFAPPPGYELEAHQVMCRAVGGDLYHCVARPDGSLFFALGDVSGKGMPAALAMAAAIVLIGLLAEIGGALEEMVAHLQDHLYRSIASDQYVTLFFGELEPSTGRLRYVNAGHEPPLLFRAGGELELLESTTTPVAMFPFLKVQSRESGLGPGDLLAVMSDGIPEATTDGVTFFEEEPVKNIIRENLAKPLPDIRGALISSVETFLKGEPVSDDVTLLLLRRAGA
jgi:sigma-B regulation protein RsbU (phosphoserine phosphatase)